MPHILDEQTFTSVENWPSHFRYDQVIHGTYSRFQYSIEEHGLIAGGVETPPGHEPRLHIHMCSPRMGKTGSVRSGHRHNADLILYIDFRRALEDGIVFWKSYSDVILTRGENNSGYLPPQYITSAEDQYGGRLFFGRRETNRLFQRYLLSGM